MTDSTTLDSQLDAYGRRAAQRGRRRPATRELIGYTAAAGGLAFAGGDAMGAIQHNTTGVTFSATAIAFQYWDIDGGGTDFRWLIRASSGADNNSVSAFSFYSDNAVRSGAGLASALASGVTVGPTLASFGDFALLMRSSTQGNFVNTTAYLGFRFDGNFDGLGGFKYGWAKARTESFGANTEGVRLILSEWAWDDSGAPIQVGDTGEVPAPATPLLTLLGLGAMGVMAYRRRREDALKRLAAELEGAAA